MSGSTLERVSAGNGIRLLGDGVPGGDVNMARATLKHWEEWFAYWAGRGDDYESLARQAVAKEHQGRELPFENRCLARGLATCTFDGPGQGEMYFQTRMRPDFHRCASVVVDWLERRPEIDIGRLGVLGRKPRRFLRLAQCRA